MKLQRAFTCAGPTAGGATVGGHVASALAGPRELSVHDRSTYLSVALFSNQFRYCASHSETTIVRLDATPSCWPVFGATVGGPILMTLTDVNTVRVTVPTLWLTTWPL